MEPTFLFEVAENIFSFLESPADHETFKGKKVMTNVFFLRRSLVKFGTFCDTGSASKKNENFGGAKISSHRRNSIRWVYHLVSVSSPDCIKMREMGKFSLGRCCSVIRAGTFDGLREGRGFGESGEGSSFQLRKFDNQVLTHPCLCGWLDGTDLCPTSVVCTYTKYPDIATK